MFVNRSEYADGVKNSSSEDDSDSEDDVEDLIRNSSEDRFSHVEYAIKLGSTAIGIRTSEGVVIAIERRITSPLIEPATAEKMIEVDKHTTADAEHWYFFDKMSVESCAQAVSIAIQLDNSDGNYSFSAATLFAGIDDGDPKLWHMDSLSTYIQYDAKAIGSGSEKAQQNLQVNIE